MKKEHAIQKRPHRRAHQGRIKDGSNHHARLFQQARYTLSRQPQRTQKLVACGHAPCRRCS